MNKEESSLYRISEGLDMFLPHVSVDCVILAFHSKSLKVLLNRFKGYDKWMLPGGFVKREEDTHDSALRILAERTGLNDVYLKQFHFFGKKDRVKLDENRELLELYGIDKKIGDWYLQRFISLGYYALTKCKDIDIACAENEEVAWFAIEDIPSLYADHKHILDTAISLIRKGIGFIPIGYELLPEKFTIPELRVIYEAILGRKIDRRNFQRKMLSIGLIKPLNETRKSGAHKSPNLYTFIKEKYEEAKAYELQFMTNSL